MAQSDEAKENVVACGQTYPYYVMDFIEAAAELDKYAERAETKFSDILRIFGDILEAFCYLDSQGVVHNDPKPANILIDAQGRAIVSDLGSAKRQAAAENGTDATIITFTPRYAPENKKRLAEKDASSENRARIEIKRDAIQKWWDIYSIGLSFGEILKAFLDKHGRDVPAYEYLYVKLMIGRMLGREILDTETVLGLPRLFYVELAYESFAEAREDFSKLIGSYALAREVPELDIDSMNVIRNSSQRECHSGLVHRPQLDLPRHLLTTNIMIAPNPQATAVAANMEASPVVCISQPNKGPCAAANTYAQASKSPTPVPARLTPSRSGHNAQNED